MRKVRNEYDANDVRDIVDSLIAGMSLARVPEELHSQLLMPLSAAKNEAIVAGNTATVKRLQAIMRELRLNPGKNSRIGGSDRSSRLSSSRSNRSNSSSRPQSAFVTTRSINDRQSDIEVTIDELLDGRSIDTVDSALIPKLIPALKNRKQVYIECGDYHSSQLLEDLIQEANTRKFEAAYHSVQSSKMTNLKLQLMQAKADLEASEQFWREAKEKQENEYNESLEQLEEQHRQQLEDYDNSFPEVLPANFRKLSSHVLQIREQEKHLVLSKRYEDAIPFRERADALEAEELEQQRQKFLRSFNTQREQLIETHNSQMRCFQRNWERKWERFNKERENEISVLKKTITNFQRRIGIIENETDNANLGGYNGFTNLNTPRAVGINTPRSSSNIGNGTALPSARGTSLQSTRSQMRAAPSSVNPNVRKIAASRMTQKRPVVRRVVQHEQSY